MPIITMEDLTADPASHHVLETYRQAADTLKNMGAPWVFLPRSALFLAHWARQVPDGDWAEVGVYAGLSARILCEYKGDRTLHLFDTFGGIPYAEEGDAARAGDFKWPLFKVREFLSEIEGVRFHPGIFPGTAGIVADKQFSLVHLDADTYRATSDALAFFWPRLVVGGVVVIHDVHHKGLARAIIEHEFDGGLRHCGVQSALIKGGE